MWPTEEIVRSYRTAADKNKQIKVLSELNACSAEKIRGILIAAGAMESSGGGRKADGRRRLDEDAARALYEKGLGDDEIAGELGVSLLTAAKWRTENGLKKNKAAPRGATAKPAAAKASAAKAAKVPKRPVEEKKAAAVTVRELIALLAAADEQGYGDCAVLVEGCAFREMWLSIHAEIRANAAGARTVELMAAACGKEEESDETQ